MSFKFSRNRGNMYNLALTPVSKGEEAVKYAERLAKFADKYLLGEASLPHVTLYQFEAHEKGIEAIWMHVGKFWNEEPIELEFKQFSCLSFDNNVTFWPSLLPDNCIKLQNMHSVIAKALDKPIKENFDPHMTLLSTKNKDFANCMEALKNSYQPISDEFILSLGHSDDIGQLTKIIFSCGVKPTAISFL